MRILGIDPGTVTVGYGCLDVADPDRAAGPRRRPIAQRASNVVAVGGGGGGAARVVTLGVLRLGRRGDAIECRLGALARQLAALIGELRPDQVALECAFSGKSVQSALRIGEARGVVLATADQLAVPVVQLTPARVKRCVTGHGAAAKETVARMTQQLLGLAETPRPHDAADALAVAYTCSEQRLSLRARVGAERRR